MWPEERNCSSEGEGTGPGRVPRFSPFKRPAYVVTFAFSIKKKKKKRHDTWPDQREYSKKKDIRSRENFSTRRRPGTPPRTACPTASRSRMPPGARRPAGLPLALPLPTSHRAPRARAAATAVSGRGKWNKQLRGTRARGSEWRQNLKINRPLSSSHPLAAAAPSPPGPRPRSPYLGTASPPRRPARPL
jgi:hypothetical protein